MLPYCIFLAKNRKKQVIDVKILSISEKEMRQLQSSLLSQVSNSASYTEFKHFISRNCQNLLQHSWDQPKLSFYLYTSYEEFENKEKKFIEDYLKKEFLPWARKNKVSPLLSLTNQDFYYYGLMQSWADDQKELYNSCNFDKLPAFLIEQSDFHGRVTRVIKTLVIKIEDIYSKCGNLSFIPNRKEILSALQTTRNYKADYENDLKDIYSIEWISDIHLLIAALLKREDIFKSLVSLYKISKSNTSLDHKLIIIDNFRYSPQDTEKQLEILASQTDSMIINGGIYNSLTLSKIINKLKETQYIKNLSAQDGKDAPYPFKLLLVTEKILKGNDLIMVSGHIEDLTLKNEISTIGRFLWLKGLIERISMQIHYIENNSTKMSKFKFHGQMVNIVADIFCCKGKAPETCQPSLKELNETLDLYLKKGKIISFSKCNTLIEKTTDNLLNFFNEDKIKNSLNRYLSKNLPDIKDQDQAIKI